MDQRGIRPQSTTTDPQNHGLGRLGAVEGHVSEKDLEDLAAAGMLGEGAEELEEEVEESLGTEGPAKEDGEKGQDPKGRNAPAKPSPEEIAKHNLTHIPRRMWCKFCAEADIQEDPHWKSGVEHKDDGVPQAHMDYKEIRKGKRPFLVLREIKRLGPRSG